MQCWVGERGVALTEMVVYFATGNLSPKWPRSPSANFAKEGQRGRRIFRRGRLFRPGRTPSAPYNIAKKACYPPNTWHMGERLSWLDGRGSLGSQGGDGGKELGGNCHTGVASQPSAEVALAQLLELLRRERPMMAAGGRGSEFEGIGKTFGFS